MTTHVSVTRLVADLRSEEPSVRNRAAQLIWNHYFPALLERARDELVRRIHLGRHIRRRVDEEDVLQSMYKSFCLRQQRGEYDLANRDALWKLLVTITLNKTRNAAKHEKRKKRDIAQDQTMFVADGTESDRWVLEQMEATEPSPEEAAILNEGLERRLDALGDPDLRQIALWRLEGYTNREIADKLGCVERTVQRRLDLIRNAMTSVDIDAS